MNRDLAEEDRRAQGIGYRSPVVAGAVRSLDVGEAVRSHIAVAEEGSRLDHTLEEGRHEVVRIVEAVVDRNHRILLVVEEDHSRRRRRRHWVRLRGNHHRLHDVPGRDSLLPKTLLRSKRLDLKLIG